MGLLEELKLLNPEKEILSVEDPSFATFGCIHKNVKLPGMKKVLYGIVKEHEEMYIPCYDSLMALPEADQFKDDMFGQVPCQVGLYYGRGRKLNAVEYHKCSEILYEYEPCVIILGLLWDIENGRYDTGKMKIFYVPEDTCIELYATTLHFAPVLADAKRDVMQIVAQSLNTNTPLLKPVEGREEENKYLLQRNKWVLCHKEALDSMGPLAYEGLDGENIEIIPVGYTNERN